MLSIGPTLCEGYLIAACYSLNKDIIDDIMDLINTLDYKVNFIHIRAHTNNKDEKSINNDVVDKLAKKDAQK